MPAELSISHQATCMNVEGRGSGCPERRGRPFMVEDGSGPAAACEADWRLSARKKKPH